jgi:hypothetical protein
MNITDTTTVLASTAASALVTNPIVVAGTRNSTPVLTIVGALFLTAVSALGMAILSWFFKCQWCCWWCCFNRANNRNRDSDSDTHEYDRDRDHDHNQSPNQDLEEGGRRERHCDNETDSNTASTIPSIITIISRSSISTDLRWGRRSGRQGTRAAAAAAASVAYNKPASGSSWPTANGRRFSLRNGNGNRNRNHTRQQRRRRYRRGRPSFNTILTDDMSLPDEDCGIDSGSTMNRPSVDPPGSRLDKEAAEMDSYPNVTIQFRNPINGRDDSDEELDILVDFLVHTEEYVRYPRSKLTILLRARAPKKEEDREHLEYLRAIVEDASSTLALESESASSPHSSNSEHCTEQQQRQQQQRPPLQVFITTTTSGSSSVSSEEDLLRCAPTGGFLVTFGSVWDLPEDHPDFLKDLVV